MKDILLGAALAYIVFSEWQKRNSRKSGVLEIVTQNQKTLKKMSQAVDDLKAKIQAQSDALDTVSANVEGITADVTFLKDKLSNLPDGATAEEIAELSSLVDGLGDKVTAIGTATSDLDASTDSSGGTDNGGEEEQPEV